MLEEMINFIHSVPAVFEVITQFVEFDSRPVLFVEDELPEVVNNWITDWAGDKTFSDAEDGLNQLWEHVQATDIQDM